MPCDGFVVLSNVGSWSGVAMVFFPRVHLPGVIALSVDKK